MLEPLLQGMHDRRVSSAESEAWQDWPSKPTEDVSFIFCGVSDRRCLLSLVWCHFFTFSRCMEEIPNLFLESDEFFHDLYYWILHRTNEKGVVHQYNTAAMWNPCIPMSIIPRKLRFRLEELYSNYIKALQARSEWRRNISSQEVEKFLTMHWYQWHIWDFTKMAKPILSLPCLPIPVPIAELADLSNFS